MLIIEAAAPLRRSLREQVDELGEQEVDGAGDGGGERGVKAGLGGLDGEDGNGAIELGA